MHTNRILKHIRSTDGIHPLFQPYKFDFDQQITSLPEIS